MFTSFMSPYDFGGDSLLVDVDERVCIIRIDSKTTPQYHTYSSNQKPSNQENNEASNTKIHTSCPSSSIQIYYYYKNQLFVLSKIYN